MISDNPGNLYYILITVISGGTVFTLFLCLVVVTLTAYFAGAH